MTNDKAVSNHYSHGDLLQAIQSAIEKLGKTVNNISIEDLAPVDEFHIGGRTATETLLRQLEIKTQHQLLDVGCGLGGAARFVASEYNTQVTGIDLTEEYIKTGKALCTWLGLDKKVTLQWGSATSMPFANESFDGGYMLHVGMNIEDKEKLFKEIFRVLRKGALFGVYDVMRIKDGELTYPVPWAADSSTSKLSTRDQYKHALLGAGFDILSENNCREFALEFFRKLREKTAANGEPPPLGLHTLMKETTPIKINNMIENIAADYIAPVSIIVRKH